jgi:hypothetical protein
MFTISGLTVEADALRQRFAQLAVVPTRRSAAQARAVLDRYETVRKQLAHRHHNIDSLAQSW